MPNNLTLTRLKDRYDLTNGQLHIHIPDKLAHYASNILDSIQKNLDACSDSHKPKLTLTECKAELDRLVNLANSFVTNGPFNLFQYLPLTKQGQFPVNQTVVLATSRITTTALYPDTSNEFFEKSTVQLILTPYHKTTDSMWLDKPTPDIAVIDIDWCGTTNKKTPVFDETGHPAKIETKRTTYLKDNEIKTGYVYENKKGTQWLYLTSLHVHIDVTRHNPLNGEDQEDCYDKNFTDHTYIRWTKKLEQAMNGQTTFNAFLRAISKDDTYCPKLLDNLSIRTNPRKFVEEVGQVIDFSKTFDEAFDVVVLKAKVPAAKRDYCPTDKATFHYKIETDNLILTGEPT